MKEWTGLKIQVALNIFINTTWIKLVFNATLLMVLDIWYEKEVQRKYFEKGFKSNNSSNLNTLVNEKIQENPCIDG